MANFKTSLPSRQEQFSIAWLYAIASVAGYSVEHVKWDNDSVDAEIHQKGDGAECPLIDQINVQLKCTYATSPKNSRISYRIPRKNYDDLRGNRLTPRILVLLHVPRGIGNWLTHSNQSVLLKNCAYWTSLQGLPPKATSTVTVPISTSQRLTVSQLTKLMEMAAKGRRPEELVK